MDPIAFFVATGISLLSRMVVDKLNKDRNEKKLSEANEKRLEGAKAERERQIAFVKYQHDQYVEAESRRHKERMKDIQTDFYAEIEKLERKDLLDKWPLTLYPFILKQEALGYFANAAIPKPIVVTLAPSDCSEFNEAFYVNLDKRFADFFETYYSPVMNRPVLYLERGWKNTKEYKYAFDEIHGELNTVPMVIVHPVCINNSKIQFEVYAWSDQFPKQKCDFDLDCLVSTDDMRGSLKAMDSEEAQTMANPIFHSMINVVGLFVDGYFWDNWNILPLLPILKRDGKVEYIDIEHHLDVFARKMLVSFWCGDKKISPEQVMEYIDYLSGCIKPRTKRQLQESVIRSLAASRGYVEALGELDGDVNKGAPFERVLLWKYALEQDEEFSKMWNKIYFTV